MEVRQPGVKEEAFIQIGRRGGDRKRGGGDKEQGSGWRTRQTRLRLESHIQVQINQEEQLGSETDYATQGSSAGK